MRNLKISVVDNIVRVTPGKVLTSGEVNTVECDFILGKEFDGLVVKASFNGIIRPVIDYKCTLPESDNSGIYKIGVVGYSLDESNNLIKRESPVPAVYEVETGSYSLENDDKSTPEPSAFEIMLAKMQSIYDKGDNYILTEADKQEIADKVPGTTDYRELENIPIKQLDLTGHGRDNPLRLEVCLGENPYRGMYEITGEGYYTLTFMNMTAGGSKNVNYLKEGALLTLYMETASNGFAIETSDKGIYEIEFSDGGYGRNKLLNEAEAKELIRGISITVKSVSVNGNKVQPDSYGNVDILTNTALIKPSQTEVTLEPNKFYQFEEVAELNITLAAGDQNTVNEYMFEFVSGETPTTLTLPATVQWASDVTIEANKKYQVSILNDIGLMVGVDIV